MNWEDKTGRDIEVYSVGPVEDLIIYKETVKTGCDDDDDQPDRPDQKVGHMHNTLVTESDVTSSMMAEIYRQLVSAQLRGRLYKTGYRRMKAVPKEVQAGVTGQVYGISAVTTGTPGPPVPGTSQLKTPPRLVRLVTVPKASISAQTVLVTSPSSLVSQIPIISMRQI